MLEWRRWCIVFLGYGKLTTAAVMTACAVRTYKLSDMRPIPHFPFQKYISCVLQRCPSRSNWECSSGEWPFRKRMDRRLGLEEKELSAKFKMWHIPLSFKQLPVERNTLGCLRVRFHKFYVQRDLARRWWRTVTAADENHRKSFSNQLSRTAGDLGQSATFNGVSRWRHLFMYCGCASSSTNFCGISRTPAQLVILTVDGWAMANRLTHRAALRFAHVRDVFKSTDNFKSEAFYEKASTLKVPGSRFTVNAVVSRGCGSIKRSFQSLFSRSSTRDSVEAHSRLKFEI